MVLQPSMHLNSVTMSTRSRLLISSSVKVTAGSWGCISLRGGGATTPFLSSSGWGVSISRTWGWGVVGIGMGIIFAREVSSSPMTINFQVAGSKLSPRPYPPLARISLAAERRYVGTRRVAEVGLRQLLIDMESAPEGPGDPGFKRLRREPLPADEPGSEGHAAPEKTAAREAVHLLLDGGIFLRLCR